jgi:hypothetical protein
VFFVARVVVRILVFVFVFFVFVRVRRLFDRKWFDERRRWGCDFFG